MSVTSPPSASLVSWIRSPARWLCAALASAGLAACTIPLQQSGTVANEPTSPSLTYGPQRPPQPASARELDRPLTQAVSYRGVMPCTDCESFHITLTLLPDWTWRMRRVYQYSGGKPAQTLISTGAWERGPANASLLTLRGDRSESYQFQWVDGSRLKWLSQRGEPVPTAINELLTQQFELDPIAEVMPLRGNVSPLGSGIQFAVCGQGKAYPVSSQQQGKTLQDNYQRLRIAPGTPVLMWVNGRFASEGDPAQPVLVIESLSTGTLDAPCE